LIGSGGVRVALTALFVIPCAWYLAATVTGLRRPGPGSRRQALSFALHLLMCAAMISMFWSWGARVPAIAVVTAFTAAGGWFAGRAIFGTGGHGTGGHGTSWHGAGCYGNWYHAGMMAVMAWMPVAMELISPLPGTSGTTGGGMSMPAGDTGDMAGMSMPGMNVGGTAAGSASGAGSLGSAGIICLVLAAALFAAAAWQAVAALRPLAVPGQVRALGPPLPGTTGTTGTASVAGSVARDGIGALVAAGMAVALLVMA
jgi:hypothetical protein